jgi:hypothetical protein|nr:MAG TPA: hypothetical protein [Caudoviricetes sp.]DAS56693.1 MAG TPA: hypothetical protein [Caudoviricetes sp.]
MKIAVEDITAFISVVAGVITGGLVIFKFVNSIVQKWICSLLKPVNDRIDESNRIIMARLDANAEELKQMQLEQYKNFLTRYLADIERDTELTEIELERFNDIYTKYDNLGGNSYVHRKIDKYKEQGKL